MLIPAIALAAIVVTQQPAAAAKPPVAVLKANLGGSCSADFLVKDADGKPVYGALIHVRVRYGFWSVKRADLEVGSGSDGRARFEGLPQKARTLMYDIRKDGKKGEAEQDVSASCHATFEVALK